MLANTIEKIFTLFIIIFFSSNCFSQQSDTLQYERYYKISLAGRPQTILLVQLNDDSFKGYLLTELDYSSRKVRFTKNRTWRSVKRFVYNQTEFLRKKEIEKEIIDSLVIKSDLAETLFMNLKGNNIENIGDCRIQKNCITFLDSDYTSFEIKNNEVYRTYGFEELYSAKEVQYLETAPNNRVQAQEILTILDKELNFKETFYNTIDRLPEGSYSYFSGYSVISRNSSKKK